MLSENYRRLLKKLIPPLIVETLQGSALYPSWPSACRAAHSYTDEKLNRFKAERVALRIKGGLLTGNVLYLTAIASENARLNITDFGGSTGALGEDILAVLPEATYSVVENPTLVGLMQDRGGQVRFTTAIPPACDIFFTSGTLQYLDDPLAVLAAGFASAHYAVVLARNSFCDRELFRVQAHRLFDNGSGAVPPGYANVRMSYPHRTIKESSVMECAKEHGFQCVSRLEESSGVVPYREIVYGKQLVFLRADKQP